MVIRSKPVLGLILAVVVIVTAGFASLAFDTGYHSDITFTVMEEQGFDETPTKIVQVTNWLTDYYSTSPTSRDAVEEKLAKLHCDNLYTTEEIADYWDWLMANARMAIQSAAVSEDHMKALAFTGLVLHAVQDFYSHSNWAETHPRTPGGPYRSETWISAGAPEGVALVTGSYPPYPAPPPPGSPEHGGYDSGLNKDSQVRLLWDEAYVFAYCATHEVLGAMREWAEQARPGFWTQLRILGLSDRHARQLEADLRAAHRLSMWVKGKGADGHWKGDESGSARYMSELAAEWGSRSASVFVQQIKKDRVHESLVGGLHSEKSPPPAPPVEPFNKDVRVIMVGTTHVMQLDDTWRKASLDPGGKGDMYSVMTVGRQQYVGRVIRKKKNYVDPWLTLHIADASEENIPIMIRVWDQDGPFRVNADQCDINPVVGDQNIRLLLRVSDNMLTGDVRGYHDGPEKAFVSSGAKPDKHRIEVGFYVTSRPVNRHSVSGDPAPGDEIGR